MINTNEVAQLSEEQESALTELHHAIQLAEKKIKKKYNASRDDAAYDVLTTYKYTLGYCSDCIRNIPDKKKLDIVIEHLTERATYEWTPAPYKYIYKYVLTQLQKIAAMPHPTPLNDAQIEALAKLQLSLKTGLKKVEKRRDTTKNRLKRAIFSVSVLYLEDATNIIVSSQDDLTQLAKEYAVSTKRMRTCYRQQVQFNKFLAGQLIRIAKLTPQPAKEIKLSSEQKTRFNDLYTGIGVDLSLVYLREENRQGMTGDEAEELHIYGSELAVMQKIMRRFIHTRLNTLLYTLLSRTFTRGETHQVTELRQDVKRIVTTLI